MDKWVWVLINPGSKIFPSASIILSIFSSSISGEISLIISSLIKIDCLPSKFVFGLKINAFLIKIVKQGSVDHKIPRTCERVIWKEEQS